MTVYVVQKQMRFDQEKGELVPRFPSIFRAERWGKLSFILSPSAHPFNSDTVVGDIHEKMRKFSDDDFLLLVGNPCLIGMVTAIAAHYNDGRVKFLQWSGQRGDYTEIVSKIF